ncbi:restriction endonuclease subunit S [Photobacterium damselae subsp. damselae]|uniref:restriction endonuclease subunit S n=1 Tax=Photobacterium damselae TaxID=38293 RepID=UPI0010129C0A|nr:restriction endonuclease subunit S [Photobacterium damselae]QAY36086.1 restriction endonuclease subunit S [Photobacterium damselae subsp. damselae]
MVPNGWSNTCIDDNITFSGGAQPPREVFKFEPEEGYIRLIQIRDYKSDKFITYVPKKLAKKFCTADDVMIGRYGPPIFQILRGIEGAYNVALIKAIPKSGVDKEFMYYFLKRDPLLRVIESFSQRTSGQTGIEMDVLKAYPMHLPPLPEQRKIAQILSTWDRGIATTEKLIDASKQQKKALMQQLLTGKKRLVDPETGKAFEGEWEEVKLGDICIVNPKKASEPENGLVSFIPMDAVSEDAKLLRKEVKQYSEVFKGFTAFIDGDVLVAKITPCFENGKGAQVFGLENGVGFGSTEFHVLRAKKNISSEFIYFLTNTSEFRIRGEMNMQGSAGQKRVTTDYLKLYKMTIPKELAEQQKIASVLTAADKEIELLEAKLVHLKQEKKALMQQLLTGKKRVNLAQTMEVTV